MGAPLASLMSRTPEGKDPIFPADINVALEHLNNEYAVKMTTANSDFGGPGHTVPCYLVLEPHLPDRLASSIRRALLG
jgi:hypothetical protein